MAEPTPKSQGIRDFANALLGTDTVASITNDVCASCGQPATEFKDEISRKEFRISGLCQHCQDRMEAYLKETEEDDVS